MTDKKRRRNLPRLPQLLDRKIYKTGQTRGADDDEIFQNRVARTSTVLIPYSLWSRYLLLQNQGHVFERGYIVLISPQEYFNELQNGMKLSDNALALGENALVFYETRSDWNSHNPDALNWQPAESRACPLGGQYIARISATTSLDNGGKINHGFNTTSNKGAGIRVYEYANESTIAACRYQLEALFWLCKDSEIVAASNGMSADNATLRKAAILNECDSQGLLDKSRLINAKIINRNGHTTCPLCLEELSSQGFFSRMEQAEGRAVLDLTITQINLFHIEELRMYLFNHRTYNLAWGHHHCNVVVKDSGINETLKWMDEIVQRNISAGYYAPINNDN
jgi:hypothetical protein